MVTFQPFNSMEEMLEQIQKNRDAAMAGLHPAQAALTNGSCWVSFVAPVVIFGKVIDEDELVKEEMDAGAGKQEAREIAAQTQMNLVEHGLMYGKCYSSWVPDGEWGSTHKINAWPIEPDVYEAAEKVGWEPDLLPTSAKVLLRIAHVGYVNHRVRV